MALQEDGLGTIIGFANQPTIYLKLEEMELTPPGVDQGGMIDTTSLRNEEWRTRVFKSLKTLTPVTFTAQYDPSVYNDVLTMSGQNQLITITFGEEGTLDFWGGVDKFLPNPSRDGELPTAALTIEPTNQNEAGEEVGPVWT